MKYSTVGTVCIETEKYRENEVKTESTYMNCQAYNVHCTVSASGLKD